MQIAMWSGPRNLSTAMMYAFGARPDFDIIDEPFYAAYLHKTGINHPMRDDIMASQQIDPVGVIDDLVCLLYTSPSPRDGLLSRMPSSA